MENDKAFKNLINQQVVNLISKEIKSVYPSFNETAFKKLSKDLIPLELKQRVLLITQELKIYLPGHYPEALKVLQKVMQRKNLSGFSLWPFSEYIGQFGLDHFDESMQGMYLLTQHFTSEFAIRPYLLKDPQRVLKFFSSWTNDKDTHIRRWLSEGSRPLLPWGAKIPLFVQDPSYTLPILEKLKFDEELYVRKSIANHLNDISKNHPDVVIATLAAWEKSSPESHRAKIEWIKRQALRTLIKKGHKNALKLMGVVGKAKTTMGKLKINQKSFKLNDKLNFEFDIFSTSRNQQKLVIDYQIHFVKANGGYGTKTFKLKTFDLEAKEKVIIKKTHSLKSITTMKYYPGLHHLCIQINGEVCAQISWDFNPILN
ncbi:MAG: DNA alkylation repair protein [Bacteriovoracaceae bacterium]